MIGYLEMSNWYFYAQTGKSEWLPELADRRDEYIEKNNPEFVTVLDVNQVWGKDEVRPADLAFRGPLYLDWDGEGEIQDVLDAVKRFMSKLEDLDFNLDCALWYLSGNKGVHCTITMENFLDAETLKKVNRVGIGDLPSVYRTMVSDEQIITSFMDMRVYTSGKGRMWRTENRPRQLKDGRTTYKVGISAQQLKGLDEAGYWDWVSSPRPKIYPAPPSINTQLAVNFGRANTKVRDLRAARKRNASDEVSFSGWEGKIPPTIEEAFNGVGIQQVMDLNSIKMQLCIAATAVGFDKLSDENRFIQAIQGFIKSRVGTPGAAHQTAASIEAVMRNCFKTVAQNTCYAYTPKGFASILTSDRRKNVDLYGKQASADNREDRLKQDFEDQLDGWIADDMGIIKADKQTAKSYGNYSWKPGSLAYICNKLGDIEALSVIPLVGGEERRRVILNCKDIQVLSNIKEHMFKMGAVLVGSGQSIDRIQLAWKAYAGGVASDGEESPMIASAEGVGTEGVYVQLREDLGEEVDELSKDYDNMLNIYWVSPTKVVPSKRNMSTENQRLPQYLEKTNPEGKFESDLANCSWTLANVKMDMKPTINALLELNGNFYSLAVMLGWFTACTLKHPLYHMGLIKNFPILQVFGDAGSGKSTSMNLLLKMFVWKEDFKVNTAGSGFTDAAFRSLAIGSTSIPIVVDEVKAQNLGRSNWLDTFRQMIQNIYTIGGRIRKAGGTSKDSHSGELVNAPMFAPLAFLGETMETSQTSLMERIVCAGFHKSDKNGRESHAYHLQHNSRLISIVGWTLVQEMMEGSMKALAELHTECYKICYEKIYSGQNDRITENAAMVLTGFRFFSNVIEKYFPGVFSAKLEAMQHALLDPSHWSRDVASEVSRFLKFMSSASRDEEFSPTRAVRGRHYNFETGEGPNGTVDYLIVSADELYYLYRQRVRSIGENPVYSSQLELYQALKNSVLTVDAYDHPVLGPNCIKIDPVRMAAEGIPEFKK